MRLTLNGDFENGLAGWTETHETGYDWTVDTDSPISGEKSAKVKSGDQSPASVLTSWPFEIDNTVPVTLSFKYRFGPSTDVPNDEGNLAGNLDLAYSYDGSNWLSFSTGESAVSDLGDFEVRGFSNVIDPTNGGNPTRRSIRLRFLMGSAGQHGPAYVTIDDIELTPH